MKKFFSILFCLIICACSFTGCKKVPSYEGPPNPITLSDIAYSNTKSSNPDDYTVYIEEYGSLEEYLVVDGNYNGNVLLVRKNVFPDAKAMNTESSYYDNSVVSKFLNSTFYERIEEKVRNKIVDTSISVVKESEIGLCGVKTENINCKIFLLSASEVGVETGYLVPEEGRPLEYFLIQNNRTAERFGAAYDWWLRTPNTYYKDSMYIVTANGAVEHTDVSDTKGIRPAFCLSADTAVLKKTNGNSASYYIY